MRGKPNSRGYSAYRLHFLCSCYFIGLYVLSITELLVRIHALPMLSFCKQCGPQGSDHFVCRRLQRLTVPGVWRRANARGGLMILKALSSASNRLRCVLILSNDYYCKVPLGMWNCLNVRTWEFQPPYKTSSVTVQGPQTAHWKNLAKGAKAQ